MGTKRKKKKQHNTDKGASVAKSGSVDVRPLSLRQPGSKGGLGRAAVGGGEKQFPIFI